MTAAVTAAEVIETDEDGGVSAALDEEPALQPPRTSSIAAAMACIDPVNLHAFMANPSELADTAERFAFPLDQNCATAIHGNRICDKRTATTRYRKSNRPPFHRRGCN
jgi:hypothetical protein